MRSVYVIGPLTFLVLCLLILPVAAALLALWVLWFVSYLIYDWWRHRGKSRAGDQGGQVPR